MNNLLSQGSGGNMTESQLSAPHLSVTHYEESAPFRKCIIECGEKTLYVNGHFLAEESPFFEKVFFGKFEEDNEHILSLPTEKLDDVVTFLNVIRGKQDIDNDNCAILIKFADMWDCPTLAWKCRKYLENWVRHPFPSLAQSVDVLEMALIHGQNDFVDKILAFVATHSCEDLKKQNFLKRINDKGAIAAVYESIGRLNKEANLKPATGHYFYHDYNYPRPEMCQFDRCDDPSTAKCYHCGLALCSEHQPAFSCPGYDKNTRIVDDFKIVPAAKIPKLNDHID